MPVKERKAGDFILDVKISEVLVSPTGLKSEKILWIGGKKLAFREKIPREELFVLFGRLKLSFNEICKNVKSEG